MRVLVTRPEEDAAALVAALKARGHEALVEPMLTVAPAPGVTPPLDLDGVQALLFTSANGARAFARLSERRDLPVSPSATPVPRRRGRPALRPWRAPAATSTTWRAWQSTG